MTGVSDKQGFMFGILDKLFKDATGEIVLYRLFSVVILFLMMFAWFSKDQLFDLYKQTSYDNYLEIQNKDKDRKFEAAALEQLQIVHVSTGADFSAVFSYRPRNLNYFVDTITYEGKLPPELNEKTMSGYPVDKTSDEYLTHLSGRYFISETSDMFLPAKVKPKYEYSYSCPYFNLDNVYSGSISLFWKTKPKMEEAKIGIICKQASRTLGRIR